MIDITVKVPEDRVAGFYSMYGRWLAGPDLVAADDDGDVQHRPWMSSDTALAKIVWRKLSDPAKALFSTLIDNSGSKFSGEELAGMLGIPHGKHGVAGVLAWPGRHCFAVDRGYAWQWEYPEGENARYWMTPEMADLFRRARNSSGKAAS